jgi:zinc and cadmium transporter
MKMDVLFSIIIFTFLISLIGFVGALTLFLKENLLNKIILFLVAFSAGTFIGDAFLHLLPEAISEFGANENNILNIFLYLIFGFAFFFIFENYINWHHHHGLSHVDCSKEKNQAGEKKPIAYLILFSDGLHNFIDGLIIAASFLADFSLGIVTLLAVAFHEIPQEFGDFGVLVYSGFKKIRALFLNFLSALAVVFGGIVGYFISTSLEGSLIFFLPFAAGSFIYIASSDLIPEIRDTKNPQKATLNFLIFLAGIGLMWLLKIYSS